MTIETGSGQDSRSAPDVMLAGPRRPDRRGGRQRRAIVRAVELTALARHLTSRRFVAQVATGAIVLAAAAELMRENRARGFARLAAWDQKRRLREKLAARPLPAAAPAGNMQGLLSASG